MIKWNVKIMATEYEMECIDTTLQFLVDLVNDIEEYNIPISRSALNAIEDASNALSILCFKEGIDVISKEEFNEML